MPTMVLKQEVEATPELVADQLRKFAATMADQQFAWPAGTLLKLHNSYLKAVQGMEDMPVLVITAAKGTLLGQVAIHKADGNITMAYITAAQVDDEFKSPQP